jgi:hypothetical protein
VTRWCLLGITTSWIAAENALRHARNNISLVSEVFDKRQIPNSEYVVLAGFDESLIKSCVGYLEQIHVFVGSEVDPPLLTELGKLFSPFSSTLFTEESSYRLPVFKDDGSLWDFDELVYSTASKSANGESSTRTTSSQADGTTNLLQNNSGSGEEGEMNRGLDDNKGKKKEEANENDQKKDPSSDPENPPEGQDGTIAGPVEISITIDSEIYLIQKNEKPFQILTTKAVLTIEVCLYFYCIVVLFS